MSKYPRTVAAAVAETKSKFALAEALARDIPPRRRGAKVGPEITIMEHLILARGDIKAAGGEDRTEKTLAAYRETALWISPEIGGNFRWIKGVSFSAHLEAYETGLTYDQFTKLRDKTVDGIRRSRGLAPTRPTTNDLPLDEAAALAKKLMAEPAVAAEVVNDDKARMTVRQALDRRYDDAPKPIPLNRGGRGSTSHDLEVLGRLRSVTIAIKAATDLILSGPALKATDDMVAIVDWQTNALGIIRTALTGADDMDAELARILREN